MERSASGEFAHGGAFRRWASSRGDRLAVTDSFTSGSELIWNIGLDTYSEA